MDKFLGIINKIVYFNESNGYGIVKIKIDYKNAMHEKYRNILFSNILSVLCTFDRKPFEDEEYEFEGELETSSYGYQLKASSFRRVNENSKEGVVTYLSSELFPGIGKKAAEKVFDSLGNDALKLIVNDRNVLDDVPITSKQKDTIYSNLVIHYNKEKELIELLNFGIGMRISVRIINILGDKSSKIIKENPYQLIDLVEGIAFLRADDIAMKLGIKKDDPKRLVALIHYVIKQVTYSSGDSYIEKDDLFEKVSNFANVTDELINRESFEKYLYTLQDNKKIIIEDNQNVFDYQVYYDEINVSKAISQILKNDKLDYSKKKIPQAIQEVMEINNIVYSDKQIEAIEKALLEPISIVTGGPGTGKSTVIKGIIEAYASLFNKKDLIKNQIVLLAPTGRASKRLKEVTNHYNASTIHKFLGYQGNGRFAALTDGELKAKLIIIDEFSMVDINLISIFFKCISPLTKIVIVGDVDQLPAVGNGDVLRDLIESKEITTTRLNKIHRQASDSSIISLAHDVNEGVLPYSIIEKQHDRNFIACNDEKIVEFIKTVVKQGIDAGMDLIKDIQVLIPIYKGIVGIDSINYSLQDAFNKSDIEINYLGKRFRENDKVIQLVNRQEKQVMNGDIGYIRAINKDGDSFKSLDVQFDFGSVHYDKDELEDLTLAYAISIHKSQGSEFSLVVVPFSFKYWIMLKRKLIYTAITRAKKYLIMLGNIEAIRKGILQIEDKRKTKLQERIHSMIENGQIIMDSESAFKEIKEEKIENISIEDFMNSEKIDQTEMENISPYDFLDDGE